MTTLYIFHGFACRMQKQLQHKLKSVFECEKVEKFRMYKIDEHRSFIFTSQIISDGTQIREATSSMELIKDFCLSKNLINIAINVDFKGARSLYEFKMIVGSTICPQNINVTLFLNRVIELTNPSEIQKIISMYHDSLVSGHQGVTRTLNQFVLSRKLFKK